MVARLFFAALGGPLVGLLLFAASWVFERIIALGDATEHLLGTWASLAVVWLLLSGFVYLVLYGLQVKPPKI